MKKKIICVSLEGMILKCIAIAGKTQDPWMVWVGKGLKIHRSHLPLSQVDQIQPTLGHLAITHCATL